MIVAVFVDDIFLFGNDCREKKKLKTDLTNKFKIKDLGNARHVLEIRVRREKDEIRLDQSNYISFVLEKFGMTDCKLVTTPLEAGSKLQKGECDVPNSTRYPQDEPEYILNILGYMLDIFRIYTNPNT